MFIFLVSKLAKDEEEKEKDETEEKSNEVVFIQDIGFSVKIVAPGAESFDIQVIFYLSSSCISIFENNSLNVINFLMFCL